MARFAQDIVIEFFHDFNTKPNRRALINALVSVPRSKMHLLAPHSRIVAMVQPYLKEATVVLRFGCGRFGSQADKARGKRMVPK